MNCQECEEYIDAYIDNELDAAGSILVTQHLRGCSGCQELLENRKAVHALLSDPEIRFDLPDSLPEKIQSALPPSRSELKRKTSNRRLVIPWFTVPLALAATIAVIFGLRLLKQEGRLERPLGNALAQEAISSHVRSLLATHLLDVPSTDQHTVKPWFNGKLRFSPPVHDFADHGFRLIGGRLDYLNGREVAALVYRRNQHVINLFVWPSLSGHETAEENFTKDGFHVSHWDRDGFEFWAVSDVNADDLKAFADLQMQQG
jgi:anti-sigma factor RsiW